MNRFNTMVNILNSNGNPNAFIQQRIKSNPKYQQMMNNLNDDFIKSGLTQEQYVYRLFQEKGIDANQVKMLMQRFANFK